jgi:hypothetical protein
MPGRCRRSGWAHAEGRGAKRAGGAVAWVCTKPGNGGITSARREQALPSRLSGGEQQRVAMAFAQCVFTLRLLLAGAGQ